MLTVKIQRQILLPKHGHTHHECEDAYAIKNWDDGVSIAIADGATESSYSKEWAEMLVHAVHGTRKLTKKAFENLLPAMKKKWREQVSNLDLPWYAEIKLEQGAFSTLLYLYLDLKNAYYSSLAVGDCCLFLIRNNRAQKGFPISDEARFGNHPSLINSKADDSNELKKHLRVTRTQSLMSGDQIFLMSDALALWFVQMKSRLKMPWDILYSISKDQDTFEKWLSGERARNSIKNDDVTLIIIEIM